MAGMSDELQNLIERFNRAHDSRLFAPLADAYRKNGEIDKAIEILETGIERYPGYASARVILGKCYYDKGATERAKSEFLRVVDIDAENMVALKFMGDILLAEDKRGEASEYFKKVLAIDPMNEDVAKALKEMESAFSVKDIDLGDRKAVRDERPRELASMTLAGIYAAQGYYNKALKIYGEVLEREPGNREALEMVSKLQAIMDSANAERGKAFEDGVLTISVDDISEDIVGSTAGHGGAAPSPEEAAAVAGEVREAAEGVSENVESPGEERREPEAMSARAADAEAAQPAAEAEDFPPVGEEVESGPAEKTGDAPSEEFPGPAGRKPGDFESFREWVKRLKKT